MARSNDPQDYSPEELRDALLFVAELVVADAAPPWAFTLLEKALAAHEQDDAKFRAQQLLRQSRPVAL